MICATLKTAVNATKAIKKENPNAEAQIALCYTLGDAYTLDYWKKIAKSIEDMGADSICIKDMAGLLVPYKATELVTALKRRNKASDSDCIPTTPLVLHP